MSKFHKPFIHKLKRIPMYGLLLHMKHQCLTNTACINQSFMRHQMRKKFQN
ncbi:hypothetical protein HanXRQr2_Chr07g0279781 [Helianthus annuus]|uniref:Uncharacterized protein n=1 Tax=Helianthus annuus TaxID=4232 RepID=A0A9K3IIZ6_HELAN|nr:hypothetical protein HanXRQr2_Chr07g0279781 [Helianthus annuus]KAJ0891113.1 hypothetical protein HanPSC8_Chr09g0349801 [Helianthus annuus]